MKDLKRRSIMPNEPNGIMQIINNRTADHTPEVRYPDSTKHADNSGVNGSFSTLSRLYSI